MADAHSPYPRMKREQDLAAQVMNKLDPEYAAPAAETPKPPAAPPQTEPTYVDENVLDARGNVLTQRRDLKTGKILIPPRFVP